MKQFRTSPGEGGNALYLVLLGVALFAALSYAVTQSSRQSGNIETEKLGLDIGHLIQTMTTIQTTVDELVLSGCPKTGISFEGAPSATGSYGNSNPPNDGTCDIFNPVGGGLKYEDPPATLLDPAYAANTDYGRMKFLRNINMVAGNVEGSATNYTQMIIVPYISDAACLAMNRKLYNHNAIPANTTSDTINLAMTYSGTYTSGAYYGCNVNAPPVYNPNGGSPCGRQLGCFTIGTLNPGTLSNVNVIYYIVTRGAP